MSPGRPVGVAGPAGDQTGPALIRDTDEWGAKRRIGGGHNWWRSKWGPQLCQRSKGEIGEIARYNPLVIVF